MARILLIEDDDAVRTVLLEILQVDSHHVTEARDGAEGLALLAITSVDLIITDILLPDKDGLEVIAAVKRGAASPPVIAISGDRRRMVGTYLHTAKKLGAAFVLEKPVSRGTLLCAVNSALSASASAAK